jgi:hypothetical protein
MIALTASQISTAKISTSDICIAKVSTRKVLPFERSPSLPTHFLHEVSQAIILQNQQPSISPPNQF